MFRRNRPPKLPPGKPREEKGPAAARAPRRLGRIQTLTRSESVVAPPPAPFQRPWTKRIGPYPVWPSGYTFGASASSVVSGPVTDQVIANYFGGRLLSFHSVRGGVTSSGGKVSAWNSLISIGPTIGQSTGTKQPTISGSGSSLAIATDGSSTWLQSAFSPTFDMSQGGGKTVWVVALADSTAAHAYGLGLSTASDNPLMGPSVAGTQLGYISTHYQSSSVDLAYTALAARTCSNRMYLFGGWTGSAGLLGFQFPPLVPVTLAISAPGSGNAAICVGVDGSQGFFNKITIRALIVVNGTPQTNDASMMQSWATYNEFAQNDPTALVVFDGDSISFGYGLTNPDVNFETLLLGNAAFSTFSSLNFGVPGQYQSQMLANAPTRVDPTYRGSRTANKLALLGGIVDLSNNVPLATLEANVQSYHQARQAVGWTTYACTVLPAQSCSGSNETNRLAFNTWLRSNYASFAHGLIDYSSDPNMGQTGQWSNTTYYQADGIHPTATGHSVMSTYAIPALQV